jgi:hypothetical protein
MMEFSEAIFVIFQKLWMLFMTFFCSSTDSGQFNTNVGLRYTTGMIMASILFIILKMKATETLKKEHIIAMIGSMFLFVRYLTSMVLEWGYYIGLYNDPIMFFMSPPLEHFFYTMFVGCFAYYTLNHLNFYPGLLKKILYAIPITISSFFIYNVYKWKQFVETADVVGKHSYCSLNWDSHIIIVVFIVYIISVYFYKKNQVQSNDYLILFWIIMLVSNLCMIYSRIDTINFKSYLLASYTFDFLSVPILSLHFIKSYINRAKFCTTCEKYNMAVLLNREI